MEFLQLKTLIIAASQNNSSNDKSEYFTLNFFVNRLWIHDQICYYAFFCNFFENISSQTMPSETVIEQTHRCKNFEVQKRTRCRNAGVIQSGLSL